MLKEQQKKLTASELAAITAMDRTNASRYLNELVKDQLVAKDESRLVTRSS
jgi:Fic family protein